MILNELMPYALADVEAGNAIILVGPSGRGKSEWSNEFYAHLKRRGAERGETWGFQSMFLATYTPPDILGITFKGEGEFEGRKFTKTDISMPPWFVSTEGKPAWAYDKFFLLLDEYGQGEADVKRVSAELLLHGAVGPWKLPAGSARVACSNAGVRYGVTKDFDFCINRRQEYHITDDLNGWLEWADRPSYEHAGETWTVSPWIKAFARQNEQILFEAEPKVQGPWCTPRALMGVDRKLQKLEQVTGKKVEHSNGRVMEAIAAGIGSTATQGLAAWLQARFEIPSIEDVLADPDACPVPTKPDHLMLMAYELAGKVKQDQLAKVIHYMLRLPKDLGITFAQAVVRRDKSVVLHPAMVDWTSKNATLLTILQGLSAY